VIECPECGSTEVEAHEYDDGSVEFACLDCHYYFTEFQ
jgi:transposase-like protein